jgi:hypothetical protein
MTNPYRDLATKESLQASEATLVNVRDRHARAAAAWTVLADRADHTTQMRNDRDAARVIAENPAE